MVASPSHDPTPSNPPASAEGPRNGVAPAVPDFPRAQRRPGRPVVRVLWITLALNLVNFIIKFGVGLATGNLTIVSDALHGLLDAANNILGIFSLKVSYRPPDANHPYGHRKFEAVAALAIGALMALTSWEILRSVVTRLLEDGWRAQGTWTAPIPWQVGLVLFGLALNVFVTVYETRRGRALKSQFLLADAAHTRGDIYVTLMSIASLVFTSRLPLLDCLLSLVIVGLILRSGWRVIRDNLLLLTDAAQMDPAPIRAVVETIAGVENCHAIRSHGMPDQIHLDLHIVVGADLTATDAHAIESHVRQALLDRFPEVAEVAIHHQTHVPETDLPLGREDLARRAHPPPPV